MKRYSVSIPITGYVIVEIDAESEEAAIEAALDTEITSDLIEEWETHRQVTRGNVCSAILNSAEAEEIGEAEGEA